MGEKRREVVAYAITYAPPGVKGGPYEGAGALGQTEPKLALAYRYKYADGASPDAEWLRNNGHTARVIRIVRAERPSPSGQEASAVDVLRALLPMIADPTCDTPGCPGCAAYARARRVLADSGPDPSEVVRAAMAWGHACKAYGGRPLDLELEALAAVDAYRKAGGK